MKRFLVHQSGGDRVFSGSRAILLSAFLTLSACGSAEDAAPASALPVSVTDAVRRDVPIYIEMVGGTLGNQEVPIRARVEGFLESMDFQEGRFVSKGDLLYTIDPQPFQAKLVEAQSKLASAQTQLAKAAADLGRIKPLAASNAVSQQQLDASVAQESAARAGVNAAKAGVNLTEIELGYTRIYASIDGKMGLTNAKPGEFVGRDPNPVVLNTLVDIDPIRVRFSISEQEYLKFAREMRATTASNSAAERNAEMDENVRNNPLVLILSDGTEYAEVGYLDGNAQSIDSATGTFTLEATFPNPSGYMLPGQFARVRAQYDVLEQAVVVPRRAIVEIQGLFMVYTVTAENLVNIVPVTMGAIDGNQVVITSGLSGGERIIVEGVQKVRKGSPVTPLPYDDASGKPTGS